MVLLCPEWWQRTCEGGRRVWIWTEPSRLTVQLPASGPRSTEQKRACSPGAGMRGLRAGVWLSLRNKAGSRVQRTPSVSVKGPGCQSLEGAWWNGAVFGAGLGLPLDPSYQWCPGYGISSTCQVSSLVWKAFAHSRLPWRQWAAATSGGGSSAVSGEQLPKCILTTCHRSTSRNSTSNAVLVYILEMSFSWDYTFLMKLLVILALYFPKQLGISTGISSLKLLTRK